MPRYKEYNKIRLTEKAMYQFWRHGYGATSLAVLIKALGVNKFSFYDAFESKENLLVETLAYHYKTRVLPLLEKLEQDHDINGFFNAMLESGKYELRGCYILTMTSETGMSIPPAVTLLQEYMQNLTRILETIVSISQPNKSAKEHYNLSRQLLALFTSIPLMHPIKPGRSCMEYAADVLAIMKFNPPDSYATQS